MKIYHTTNSGYRYDKRIFWGLMVAILLIFGYIAYQYDFNFMPRFYINCKDFSGCKNPFLDPAVTCTFASMNCKNNCNYEWCDKPTLEYGEYGDKPPDSFLFKRFDLIAVSLVIVAFLLNHFVHNKGKRPDVKLNIPDKWRKKVKEIAEKIEED